MRIEIAGKKKIIDRPQLGQVVFDRCSAQGKSLTTVEQFYSLGIFGTWIADVLRFI